MKKRYFAMDRSKTEGWSFHAHVKDYQYLIIEEHFKHTAIKLTLDQLPPIDFLMPNDNVSEWTKDAKVPFLLHALRTSVSLQIGSTSMWVPGIHWVLDHYWRKHKDVKVALQTYLELLQDGIKKLRGNSSEDDVKTTGLWRQTDCPGLLERMTGQKKALRDPRKSQNQKSEGLKEAIELSLGLVKEANDDEGIIHGVELKWLGTFLTEEAAESYADALIDWVNDSSMTFTTLEKKIHSHFTLQIPRQNVAQIANASVASHAARVGKFSLKNSPNAIKTTLRKEDDNNDQEVERMSHTDAAAVRARSDTSSLFTCAVFEQLQTTDEDNLHSTPSKRPIEVQIQRATHRKKRRIIVIEEDEDGSNIGTQSATESPSGKGNSSNGSTESPTHKDQDIEQSTIQNSGTKKKKNNSSNGTTKSSTRKDKGAEKKKKGTAAPSSFKDGGMVQFGGEANQRKSARTCAQHKKSYAES